MPHLRDQSPILDPRLGLIAREPSPKDWPVAEILAAGRIESRCWPCERHLNQCLTSACVGYACAHELAADPCRVVVDRKLAWEIYTEAQKIDSLPGGEYEGSPQYGQGTTLQAAAEVLRARGYLDSYRWAYDAAQVAAAISQVGPVVLGIRWHEGMYHPDESNTIYPTGDTRGRHAILARRVDAKWWRVLLHNSWGRLWGRNGCAWIGFDDLDSLLTGHRGEALVPILRRRPLGGG